MSVYCKAYNHEKYIRSCLEGFVNQKTNFKFEVIIHDDASTDKTPEIIKEYQEKYPEIIRPIFQKENQYSKRVPVLSLYMLPMMRGKYIACCEGDDFWTSENKLQMQVDFLESNSEYSACVHNTEVLNISNGRKFKYYNDKDRNVTMSDVIKGSHYCYHTSSLMYRIQYAKERPEFLRIQKGVGDYPLGIYLAMMGKIKFFGQVMSVYRYGTEGSWTHRMGNDSKKIILSYKDKIKMLEAANEYSSRKYEDLFQAKIMQTRCDILIQEEKYKELKKAPYKEYYKAYPIKIKIKVSMLQHCPKLYWFIRKFRKFYI